jgi:ribose-phosphate pyrophosphokinase
MRLFAGSAHPALANQIANELGVELGDMEVGRFADGEVHVKINESVRGDDVFLIQPTCPPVDANLMEMLVMTDAFVRGSAGRVVAVLPYYGYARQDRKARGREPISAKLVANLLTVAGIKRVLTVHLHTGQIQGFFDLPLDHLFARRIIAEHFLTKGLGGDDTVVVSPDAGGVDEARHLADDLSCGLAIIAKRRVQANKAEIVEIIGDFKGRRAILVDDMIDTAGSITNGAEAVFERGAAEVHCAATHALLSGNAIERLSSESVKSVVVTDTIPVPVEKRLEKMRILSVAPLLADAIDRIHRDDSVSAVLVSKVGGQRRMF